MEGRVWALWRCSRRSVVLLDWPGAHERAHNPPRGRIWSCCAAGRRASPAPLRPIDSEPQLCGPPHAPPKPPPAPFPQPVPSGSPDALGARRSRLAVAVSPMQAAPTRPASLRRAGLPVPHAPCLCSCPRLLQRSRAWIAGRSSYPPPWPTPFSPTRRRRCPPPSPGHNRSSRFAWPACWQADRRRLSSDRRDGGTAHAHKPAAAAAGRHCGGGGCGRGTQPVRSPPGCSRRCAHLPARLQVRFIGEGLFGCSEHQG